jgi:hypothetical protein
LQVLLNVGGSRTAPVLIIGVIPAADLAAVLAVAKMKLKMTEKQKGIPLKTSVVT